MTRPARQLRSDIDLPPLRMVTGREQPLKVREQRVDKIGNVAVAVGKISHVGSHHHGPDRYRVGRLLTRDEPGIVGGCDPAWNIGASHRRRERDTEQMETIGSIDGLKERGRFRYDKRESRYLAVPQLLQRGVLVIVRDLGA